MNAPHTACRPESEATPAQRVCQNARQRLDESHYAALRNVSCNYCNGVLTLEGRVSRYYFKQIAGVLASQVDEVQQLVNAIEVIDSDRESPYFPECA